LGQLVVAWQEVNSVRVLALERGEEVEQLVGLVAAGGVAVGAVDQFLHDQVAARLPAQVRALQDAPEVLDVAVQVAGDQHVVGVKVNEVAAAAGSVAAGLGGAAQGVQQAVGVRHGGWPSAPPRCPHRRRGASAWRHCTGGVRCCTTVGRGGELKKPVKYGRNLRALLPAVFV
jgi:hypothetical protein